MYFDRAGKLSIFPFLKVSCSPPHGFTNSRIWDWEFVKSHDKQLIKSHYNTYIVSTYTYTVAAHLIAALGLRAAHENSSLFSIQDLFGKSPRG